MSVQADSTSDQRTCGKGLAERAPFPAKLAELIATLAENLERHQGTLDVSDDNARKELDAYVRLASSFSAIAKQLGGAAREMAGYRGLPMARHEAGRMADPKLREAFATFVEQEEELLTLLEDFLDRDRAMLRAMTTD